MSLYHEAADILIAPQNAGGSLKSRIFSNKTLKSQPAQIYALVIETCKWSLILKEVIERAELLNLERKLTPILSLLLVHDLLLAKNGISLPTTHGLRTAAERNKARLQAELTKARIARKLGSIESLKQYVETGQEGALNKEAPHPRWIRINTLKTQLEDLLETTFSGYVRVGTVDAVRRRGTPRLYIDEHVPNLVAIPAGTDLSKSDAYTSGAIIFQDKASCFPAYMLDPLPEDGDIIDTCAAPGNKTTHIAAIAKSHASELEDRAQTIHAFEKDRARAETLKKMVGLAGSQDFTQIHAGQDFLKLDPKGPEFREVGALLLDPSCSGSGIVGRDEMPELHLPSPKSSGSPPKGKGKAKSSAQETLKRKRDNEKEPLEIIGDDGVVTPVRSTADLAARLDALSSFQLSLLLHAFAFPAARKITYSTCSIHVTENEDVVAQALQSKIAQERGWRILKRSEQVRGLREWPIRGDKEACKGVVDGPDVAEACIRAPKGDQHGTMGFFLAGFVQDPKGKKEGDEAPGVLRDERGFIVRDLLGFPVTNAPEDPEVADADEWSGFADDGDDDSGGLASTDLLINGGSMTSELVPDPEKEPVKKRKRKTRK